MRETVLPVWLRRLLGVACCSALGVAMAIASGASARAVSAAAASRCPALNVRGTYNLEVWLGDGLGGGVLGGVYYPLEITNVSRHSCTLAGYPGVSAYRSNYTQLGPAAGRTGQPHRTIVLAPGATAHALIKITDWGVVCSTSVEAAGLRVFPPGQTVSQTIPFPFGACAHRRVLTIGPVVAGVGIPG